MKKLVQLVCVVAISAGVFGIAPTVKAQAIPCGGLTVIRNTGGESGNTITCVTNVNAVVTCQNGVYVLDSNSQKAISGDVVGTIVSVSGDATNSNNQTVQIGSSCATTTTTTPTTPTTPTPVVPAPSPSVPAKKVVALPYTSATNTVAIITTTIVAAAALFAMSRLAIAAYRRTQK